MLDPLLRLFDTSDFPPRWSCGNWSPWLGWWTIASDALIFLAYAAIPIALFLVARRRRQAPFSGLLLLFVAFILACGLTHLLEAIIFWWPAYRLMAAMKAVTAIVSVATAIALVRRLPALLALPTAAAARDALASELDVERDARAALDAERSVIEERAAELTGRTRRLTSALAAATAVACRWEVASARVLWEIGYAESCLAIGHRATRAFDAWPRLLDDAELDRLRRCVADAGESGVDFEGPLRGRTDLRIRLRATVDPTVAGDEPTATGLFRIMPA